MTEELRKGENLCKVSKEEAKELQAIHMRHIALNELMSRLIADKTRLNVLEQEYWFKIAEKYMLKKGINYHINLQTCELTRQGNI